MAQGVADLALQLLSFSVSVFAASCVNIFECSSSVSLTLLFYLRIFPFQRSLCLKILSAVIHYQLPLHIKT